MRPEATSVCGLKRLVYAASTTRKLTTCRDTLVKSLDALVTSASGTRRRCICVTRCTDTLVKSLDAQIHGLLVLVVKPVHQQFASAGACEQLGVYLID